jgi:hypothetical protein
VQGWYKCPDGRWRTNATGAKLTAADERRAVQRFLDRKAKNDPARVVRLPVSLDQEPAPIVPVATFGGEPVPMKDVGRCPIGGAYLGKFREESRSGIRLQSGR